MKSKERLIVSFYRSLRALGMQPVECSPRPGIYIAFDVRRTRHSASAAPAPLFQISYCSTCAFRSGSKRPYDDLPAQAGMRRKRPAAGASQHPERLHVGFQHGLLLGALVGVLL